MNRDVELRSGPDRWLAFARRGRSPRAFGHQLVARPDCERMGINPGEPISHCKKLQGLSPLSTKTRW